MLWWGKAIAGGIATLIGGPMAGVAALGIGHQMDRDLDGLRRAYGPPQDARAQERLVRQWRTALFSLAGALARTAELAPARRAALLEGLLADEALGMVGRTRARALFRDGERADFPLTPVVNQFRRTFQRRPDQAFALLSALLPVVADLDASPPARQLLQDIAARLDVRPRRLERLAAAWQAARREVQRAQGRLSRREAAGVLGVSPWASRAEVTRAYRLALSRHHPDKLAYRHPTPEALAAATQRTDQIRKAYRRLTRE